MVTETLKSFPVDHILQIFIIPDFDLLDFVGCTETVKEIDERNAALESGKMRYRCEVHDFLNGRTAEHRTASLTTCIDIGMITENGKGMAGNRTGRYVENARELFAGYLVEVRDHEKKSLGSRKCSGHSTGSEGSVISTRGTCLGLHLGNLYFLTEDILAARCCPLIHMLRHDG